MFVQVCNVIHLDLAAPDNTLCLKILKSPAKLFAPDQFSLGLQWRQQGVVS